MGFRLEDLRDGALEDEELEEDEDEEDESESESESEDSESEVLLSESELDSELDSEDDSEDEGDATRRCDRVLLVGGFDTALPLSVFERFLGGLLASAMTMPRREQVRR